MAINLSVLGGHLVADAEPRYTAEGKAITRIRIGVSGRKDGDALFINVTTWEKLAEACQRLKKGDPVLVQGSLRANRWTTKEGQQREAIELTAHTVEFLPRGERSQAEQPSSQLAKPGPTFRTTHVPAPGTDKQARLEDAAGADLDKELF